jgi:TRAP-type C4-dicarboxylate transport system substrate-binding protein
MTGKSVGSLLAIATAFLAATGSVSAKELIYGAGIPAKSEEIALGVNAYAEELGKASNGAFTMKVLAGAQVVSLENTLANLRDGTIDAGFVVPTFTRKELRHTNVIYDTEVFGDDPAAITGAANETMLLDCKECMDDFRENGAVYLGSFGNNNKGLICRKEVKTLADVKGLKIRAVGATTRLIAEMGAVPVVMSPPDATTAIERGAIDCVHAVTTWLQNFGYWDVAKYVLETPLGSPRTISSVVYGRRAWDNMTAQEKKFAIEGVPMHLARMVYLVNVNADARIKEQAIKEHHVVFREGGRDFEELMKNFQKKESIDIPKIDKEQLGVADADKIFATFAKNLEKWEKMAKATNMKNDMNAMAAAYKHEIYDKLDPSKL